MQRVFDFLRCDDLPPLTRPNYAAELRQITLWGLVVGAVDGALASIVASKTFHASEAVTTLVWALPSLMNVLNVFWSAFLRGRPRVRLFVIIAICGLVGVASIGVNPRTWPHADWVFAAQVGFIHLFLTGLITLRTTMWRANYPDTHRARIAGRLQTVRLLLTLASGSALGALFDWQAWAYQLMYPLIAVAGLASLWPLRRIRVRGEKLETRRYREQAAATALANARPAARLWSSLAEAGAILRTDRLFAKYMAAQFLLGAANFFTEPLLINIITKRFDFRYLDSVLMMTVTPSVVMLLTIRFWAPLFDRIGVLRFRIWNSLMWTLSYLVTTIAMIVILLGGDGLLPLMIVILGLARVVNGLGRAGATIAWFIGHLYFARPNQTELYMGIHVGLTGLRALIMPFIGLACGRWIGYGSFVVALTLATCGHVLFRRVARDGARLSADAAT